jgi:hypothetical protein
VEECLYVLGDEVGREEEVEGVVWRERWHCGRSVRRPGRCYAVTSGPAGADTGNRHRQVEHRDTSI